MLDKIFSIKTTEESKIFTILGIKFKRYSAKNHLKKMNNQLKHIEECVKSINEHSNRTLTFYPFEDLLEKDFYKKFAQTDIAQRYVEFTKNLDRESIQLFDKILYRILQYGRCGQTQFALDDEEYKGILEFIRHVNSVLVLSDDYISVNGYCLPKDFIFCSTAVIYKHFIDSIKDKNKILNGDIIDAGAYIGDSALVLSDYTNCKIHAFEPENINFENLKKTIKINKLEDKIVPVKMGLGKEVSTCTLHVDKESLICASFCKDDKKETTNQEVNITTIDKYVEENNIQKVGLIKVDIEGFEQDLLKGAMNTIRRDKPVLMMSIYHNFNDFWNIKPLIESWNLGYTFTLKKPITLDYVGDLVLNAEVPAEKEEN